ncbi:glucosyltransferase domain-containing protein [Francisella philomiragia]|uniref:Glucosyl transferase GtrII family protein n=1 Tax=Francisella philomiragia TaxID=28110 RepID=A0A0B6D553_9GAMM|nr:glucosyltransferase domain-containing protein [Francisella philomiragia]AJI53996.1 glucosyl transferase GtrII family protein [Francisella philomiragia]
MRQFILELSDTIKSNKYIVIITAISAFASYAYFIFSWNITIDTELATYDIGNSDFLYPLYIQFIKLGRPILGFFTFFLGQPTPYFNSLLAIIFLFFSYLIWILIITKLNSDKTLIVIFGLFYLISPIYIFQFSFFNQSMIVGLGFVFSALSLYYLTLSYKSSNRYKSILISIIFLYLALGIYQAFIILFLEGAIYTLIVSGLNTNINTKAIRNHISLVFVVTLIALIAYFITTHIIYLFIPKSNYLSLAFDGWLNNQSLWDSIVILTNYLYQLLTSQFTILYDLCFILLISLLFKIKFYNFLLVLAGLIIPILMPLLFLSPMPLRTLFAIPFSIALMAVVCYRAFQYKKLILIVSIFISLINFNQISKLTYSENMAQKYNERIVTSIYQDIYHTYGNSTYHTAIVFVASKNIENNYFIKETLKQPFHTSNDLDLFSNIFPDQSWQDSNLNHRAYYFMHWLGLYYQMPTYEQIKQAKYLATNMPIYPDKGAIELKDNIIIVKLSN